MYNRAMDLEKLAIMMKEGFDAVDARFDAVDARFDAMDLRMDTMQATMEEKFGSVDRRLDSLEAEIQALRGDLDNVKTFSKEIDYAIARISELEKEVAALRKRIARA